MLDGRASEASEVGRNEEVADSSLTFLRVWALSEAGELGERLFEYPVLGGSDVLLPDGDHVRLLLIPPHRIYHYLGVRFNRQMSPVEYLERIHARGMAKKPARDWLLTACLLDGRLDDFVKALPGFYDVTQELPKHYREALILYTHLKNNPAMVFHDDVMDADYDDFQKLRRTHADLRLRNARLKSSYGKSYWYYYYTRLKSHDQ